MPPHSTTMKYLAVDFKITCSNTLVDVVTGLLAAIAGEYGFEAFEDTPQGLTGYIIDNLFNKGDLDNALSTFPIANVSITYTLHSIEEKNWNVEWETAGFKPVKINDVCTIYDARHCDKVNVDVKPLDVFIETERAFGTGTHATTRIMIKAIFSTDLRGKRFLDCGTGTGILGIVASKKGANVVTGYDTDEWCVRNAKHNALINGITNFEVLSGDANVLARADAQYDIVAANINRNVLLADMPSFKDVMSKGSTLLLSGFYDKDVKLIIEKAEALGLHHEKTMTEDGWACVVLRN